MLDAQLNQLLIRLADATRDLPPSRETDEVRDRTVDVIRHLETKQLIPRTNWNLGPR